ncbi:MAG: hypothetical protein L0332_17350 [Chloroflexi bacterium]|nr:hypothetical protein [Chloroflexota bacterium]MCI0579212.1 hypothetical protein [Chloroflexota bacterium]MCI0648275.1 hypothetical protein [Chloroflexota bacterium]MCI0728467.1 hypothetical protein [Chloroflexota bacterium]
MDYFVPEFVNRLPQLEAFENVLAGRLNRHIFLIEGEGAIGKSFLLEQFLYMADQRMFSRLDFRDEGAHTFLSLIQTAISDLGYQRFPATSTAINRVTIEAQNTILLKSEVVHQPQEIDQAQLRHILTEYFSLADLQNLAFDLSVDYERFPGQGKDNIARELITYLKNQGRLSELVSAGRKWRPAAPWPEVTRSPSDESSLAYQDIALYDNNHFLPPTMDRWQQQAFEQSISALFFEELSVLAQDQAVILSYDSFEKAPLEACRWLVEQLLDELTRGRLQNVLVIVSGREIPNVSGKHKLTSITVQTRLENFDFDTVRTYWVTCRGLSGDLLERIYEETRGHPHELAKKANESGGRPLSHQVMVI